MKKILDRFVEIKRCAKTGRIKSINPKVGSTKLLFVLVGVISTIWVLYKVITKPSRINYPCIQAAAPFASGFLIYLAASVVSFFTFKKLEKKFSFAKYFTFASLLVFAVIIYSSSNNGELSNLFANSSETFQLSATSTYSDTSNAPIGTARGVMPGRVVWGFNTKAVTQTWSPSSSIPYYDPSNYNLDVIEKMFNQSILKLTESSALDESWTKIFKYFNASKGKGEVGYKAGEKIFIKINMVSSGGTATDNNFNMKNKSNTSWTSPPVILLMLRNLVNVVGVPQENISLGDPMHVVIKPYYDLFYKEFPKVNYVSNKVGTDPGRVFSQKGSHADLVYSDKGVVLRTGNPVLSDWTHGNELGDAVTKDTLYKVIEDADYLINMASLKIHERAGISLCAKNHFGSHVRANARQLHMGLVSPNQGGDNDPVKRFDYGMYRVLVDLMGAEKLGGNTLLFFVDGLWGGTGSGGAPVKYLMSPFGNNYPSSIFVSQDNVAIESVCYDILKTEFISGNHSNMSFAQMPGIDDYLKQAADKKYWPKNFVYDPENDGTPIPSLGVYEHWNNSTDKQYSRNLKTGNGIELLRTDGTVVSVKKESNKIPSDFTLSQNYPNPFNPTTTIKYSIVKPGNVNLSIYNLSGQLVAVLQNGNQNAGIYSVEFDASNLGSGIYFYRLTSNNNSFTKKMILVK